MKKGPSNKAVYRTEYAPYPWVLEQARFRFEIGEAATRVISEIHFRSNPASAAAGDIELDGQGMELVSVSLDGRKLGEAEFDRTPDKLKTSERAALYR